MSAIVFYSKEAVTVTMSPDAAKFLAERMRNIPNKNQYDNNFIDLLMQYSEKSIQAKKDDDKEFWDKLPGNSV